MATGTIRIDWDTAKADLATLPKKFTEAAFEALLKQAELMKGLWQVYVNVDTGSARDSIRVERGGEGEEWRRVRVRGGGYVVNPKTGNLVNYMGIIEEKYGAGRRAYLEVLPTISEMIVANVVERST
jgi:hypothetical protein